jgi:hypothetical protein
VGVAALLCYARLSNSLIIFMQILSRKEQFSNDMMMVRPSYEISLTSSGFDGSRQVKYNKIKVMMQRQAESGQ